LQTGECLKTFYVESVLCVKILKNGNLATGSARNSITILDMVMFKLKFTLLSQRDKGITCLEQFSNEWLVAGGTYDEAIEIWDLIKRVCVRVIQSWYPIDSHYDSLIGAYRVTCLKGFEKRVDDNVEYFFAAGTSSGFLGIWNASNGACVREYRNLMPCQILSLELGLNDEIICSSERGIHLISLKTFEQKILETSTGNADEQAKYDFDVSEQLRKIAKGPENFVEILTTFTESSRLYPTDH